MQRLVQWGGRRREGSSMNNRHTVVFVALILVVGGFAIARQIVPDPPRYEFLPYKQGLAVYRGDLKTGEVQLVGMYEGKLTLWKSPQSPEKKIYSTRTSYSLTDDHMRDLGLDPETGRVADWALFKRALKERGLDEVIVE